MRHSRPIHRLCLIVGLVAALLAASGFALTTVATAQKGTLHCVAFSRSPEFFPILSILWSCGAGLWIALRLRRRSMRRTHRPRMTFPLAAEVLEGRTLLAVDFGWAIGLGSSFVLDSGGSVATDAQGNVYVTGMFGGMVDFDPGAGTFHLTASGPSSSGDIFVAKYSPAAELIWARQFTASAGFLANVGSTVQVDGAGNVHVAGTCLGTVDLDPGSGTFLVNAQGTSDGFVVKLDANGDFLWGGLITNDGSASVKSLALDGSGNVYLTGAYNSAATDVDPGPATFNVTGAGGFVVKLDSAGQFAWARTIAGSIHVAAAITVDSFGDILVAGGFLGTVDFDPGPGVFPLTSAGGTDLFVWKLDNSGNFVWARSAGSAGGDGANGVAVDGAGDIYVAGLFEGTVDFDPGPATFNLNSAGGADAVLWKLESNGNFLAARRFGSTGNDRASGVALDTAGAVYLTGFFRGSVDFDPGPDVVNLSSAGDDDLFVTKLQPDGTFVWAVRAGGPGQDTEGADGGPDLAVDSAGNVYTTGRFSGTADFAPGPDVFNLTSNGGNDAFVWKLTQTLTVQIDIKPGSDPNSINLGSNGTVPVAIFSTADFNATTVDPATVTLADATVKVRGKGTPMAAEEDVNGDGLLDLVVHVDTQGLNLTAGDVEAVLEGQTTGGQRILGVDSVRVIEGLSAPTAGNGSTAAPLTSSALDPILAEAVSQWAAAGGDVSALGNIDVRIEDLPEAFLGQAGDGVIWLDVNAAGWGWSTHSGGSSGGFDLLTVVVHELGHLLGFEHSHDHHDVMAETLAAGERRLPPPREAAFSSRLILDAMGLLPIQTRLQPAAPTEDEPIIPVFALQPARELIVVKTDGLFSDDSPVQAAVNWLWSDLSRRTEQLSTGKPEDLGQSGLGSSDSSAAELVDRALAEFDEESPGDELLADFAHPLAG